MPQDDATTLVQLIANTEAAIVSGWMEQLRASGALQSGRLGEAELQTQCRGFLQAFRTALTRGILPISDAAFDEVKDMLARMSRSRAAQGFSPSEPATFVFSLKEPLFGALRSGKGTNDRAWAINGLLDQLGLYVIDVFQKAREEVIVRQQREISELSTPVVKLWHGILALPLIGTLDSQRTQVVMENLLQSIVDESAEIAIIDITGVPTVDTLTAQHLLRTVAATRLMGADCIISGIRPQIAQTIVHLGVELNVISKASLADAFSLALKRLGRTVVPIRPAARTAAAGE